MTRSLVSPKATTASRLLSRGGAHRTFDLVVGADGLHSSAPFGFQARSRLIRDLGAYVAIFTRTTLDLDGWSLYTRCRKDSGKTAALYPVGNTGRAIAMFYFASPTGL